MKGCDGEKGGGGEKKKKGRRENGSVNQRSYPYLSRSSSNESDFDELAHARKVEKEKEKNNAVRTSRGNDRKRKKTKKEYFCYAELP